MMRKRSWVLIALFGSIILASPAIAIEEKAINNPWKKFHVSLGASFLDVSSNVRIGAKGVGVGINPEELFNMDSTTAVFRSDGYWRFTKNRKHRLDFTYFSYRREGNTVLGRDLEIGGINLPLGTEVTSSLKLDVFKVGYSYSFFQDDRIDLAIGTGLYILPIKYDFRASGFANQNQSESITAPLPLLGFRADFALTPKWFLRSNIDLFYLKISDYSGRLFNGRLGVEYTPFKHVGFGLSAESLSISVESEKSTDVPGVDFNGLFDIEQIGIFAYVSFFY